jgi:hypothetical protein
MVSSARGIQVWEEYANAAEARWIVHGHDVRGLTFDPNGRWLATITADGVRVFDGQTLAPIALPDAAGEALAAHVTPDGRWLIVEDTAGVRAWPAGSWRPVTRVPFAPGVKRATSYVTADGRWFVSNRESHLWLLDVAAERGFSLPLADPAGARRFMLDPARVHVSPDGAWVVAHGTFADPAPSRRTEANLPSETRWRAWRLPSQEEVPLGSSGGAAQPPALAALLDGSTGGGVGTADATAYRQQTQNARWRATSDGRVVRLWPLQRPDILQSACGRLTRNLSLDEWRAALGDEPYRATCRGLPQPPSTGAYRVMPRR